MTVDDEMYLQAFVALQEMRAATETEPQVPGMAAVTASQIVAYARRDTSVADFRVEAALRNDAAMRLVYRKALSGIAQMASLRVAAASEASVAQRRIGEHQLEIMTEADGMAWLVLRLADAYKTITMMELRAPDGSGRRIALGEPIDGVIQLPLDPAYPELAGLSDLIGNPATEIYLL